MSDKPFTLNAHVRERLEGWGECLCVNLPRVELTVIKD